MSSQKGRALLAALDERSAVVIEDNSSGSEMDLLTTLQSYGKARRAFYTTTLYFTY